MENDYTQWNNDIETLMHSAAGRRFVCRVLAQAGVWRTSFTTDALVMSFNEGRRDMGLWLLDTVSRVCPDEYQLMLKENADERKRKRGRRGRNADDE